MNAEGLTTLFADTTNLKPGQIRVLTKIILNYDQVEELAYQAIGLLNTGMKYSKLKDDFLAERFGWESSVFVSQQQVRNYRDKMLSTPPEVREGEMECPHCHLTKTLVVEMQTRSADEGCTYYIHCFNPKCKKVTKT